MPLSRRSFLSCGGKLALASAVAASGLRGLAFAGPETPRRVLVNIHLRGACDGLNLVSPATDPDFIAARATELRVQADGADAGHALKDAPSPDIDFRLHPMAGALAELYDAGALAFVHAVGLTDATRSHFVATDLIEHGVASVGALARVPDGWLTRAVASARPQGLISALAVSNSPSGAWLGSSTVVAIPDLGGSFAVPGGTDVAAALNQLYADERGEVERVGREALAAMREIDQRLPRDAAKKPLPYAPASGVSYDAAGDFGRPLRTLAQLVKMDVGVTAATVDLGGWDTHENQPGRFKSLVDRLSRGLGAFYDDLALDHDRLTVVVLTEFGRRLRSNRSQGTDHGRAGVMALIGGRVAGGRVYGKWPGLASEQLEEGVDLAVTTDYRAVLGAALEEWHPGTTRGVFPGYAASAPLRLFTA